MAVSRRLPAFSVAALAAVFALGGRALAQSGPFGQANQGWYAARPTLIQPGSYFVVFYQAQGGLSYLPLQGKDLPKEAVDLGSFREKTCQYGLSIPTSIAYNATKISMAMGEGDYFKTLAKMRRKHPELAGLFDIKADQQTTVVLGIFSRECMVIDARGFKGGPR
jgi:hypothetical protein